jgi:TIR domain
VTGGVFICYRRDDSSGFARGIYDRLARRLGRGNVFFDVDNIAPGLDFVDILSERVGKCHALIAVIGRDWVSAAYEDSRRRLDDPHDFVRIEIEAALERDIRVIPVLVDEATMPKPDDLPDSLKKLARRQGIKISHERFDADVRKLTRALSLLEDELRRSEAAEAERLAREENAERKTAEKAEEAERARRLTEADARREEEEGRARETAQAERTAQEEREKREAEEKAKAAERAGRLAEADAQRQDEERRASEVAEIQRGADEERQKREAGINADAAEAVAQPSLGDPQDRALAVAARRPQGAKWPVLAAISGAVILGVTLLIAEFGSRQRYSPVIEPNLPSPSNNPITPTPLFPTGPKPVEPPHTTNVRLAPAQSSVGPSERADELATSSSSASDRQKLDVSVDKKVPSLESPAPAALNYADADPQIRSELARFGVGVVTAAHGFSATIPEKSTDISKAVALLHDLGNVVSLKVESVPIDNLGSFSDLTALQSLSLRKTQVADLGALGSLSSLQSLDLWGTPVADLGPLRSLSSLHSLDLAGTKVGDLTPLKGLTALHSLDLAGTRVADLTPLKGLTALQNLDVSETLVADLRQIQDLPNLSQLSASVDEKERRRFADYRSANGLRPVQFY